MVEGIGSGNLCRLPGDAKRYGRELPLGTRRDGFFAPAPWLRRALGASRLDQAALEQRVLARVPELTGGGKLAALFPRGEQLVMQVTFADHMVRAWIDSHGAPLLDPPERRELPLPCRGCVELPWCLGVAIADSPAFAWRQLGLIEPTGLPTRRGVLFSFFQHGEGLAVAAALEDDSYAVRELAFDLANLRGGPRFSGDESLLGGRLAARCQQTYGRADFEGYLAMGAPPDYATGASEAMRDLVEHGLPKQKLQTEALRLGDIERGLVEWRSLLRHVTRAPDYDWDRWCALKTESEMLLVQTERFALTP